MTEVKPIETINVKSTQRNVSKRDITLVDKSGSSVRMTVWGKQAETFQAENNPVIAFKGVRVGDFGGRYDHRPGYFGDSSSLQVAHSLWSALVR